MCNQWLIAQPASVQRPVKLYSSHPISDRLHFKNCLLEEGHTHTHTGETHFQTHTVNKGLHTRSNPCRTLISHTLSRAHTLQPRTNSRRVFQGYFDSPPLPPPVQIKCLLSEILGEEKKIHQVIKILLERSCLWILACGGCETRPRRVLGPAAAPARPPLLHGV